MVFTGHDLWRKHPVVTKGYRAAFPGLRNAVIIFGAYCVVDFVGKKLAGGSSSHPHEAHIKWEKPAIGFPPRPASS